MKWSFSVFLLASAFSASLSCTRSCASSFVPKLDLRWQLSRARTAGTSSEHAGERTELGIAAWLRWQPTIYAAYVPERYELSPSAWIAPCEADDASCFAELAEDERELDQSLQEAP
ncbi:MAG: hypothetical protein JWN04_1561 [Myxococcaceae bacterium]|nr:hypothetical protein [Myxococcaceae bacterium]